MDRKRRKEKSNSRINCEVGIHSNGMESKIGYSIKDK
jgi:hypothetical protein